MFSDTESEDKHTTTHGDVTFRLDCSCGHSGNVDAQEINGKKNQALRAKMNWAPVRDTGSLFSSTRMEYLAKPSQF
jgi:hypothetical protein